MRRKNDKEGVKKRILSACVRLFLEQGYSNTTPKQIMEEADVSIGSFYNIFSSKSGVLNSLCEFMFENQFAIAGEIVGSGASGAILYGVETSMQLALCEADEKLRDIYLEVYTTPSLVELVHQKTGKAICTIFKEYLPENKESDFYEMEIGSSALMRGFIAKKCDVYFTLEKKLERFLWMSLVIYKVPAPEIRAIIDYVLSLDIRSIANEVIQKLFVALEMKYDFKLSEECIEEYKH